MHLPIPTVREQLRELAAIIRAAHHPDWADRIEFLATAATRRSHATQGRRKSRRMTAALAREIRRFALHNPGLSQQEIADHFGVNMGRVSQALHGDI
jgi:DNA-directed RNA polymerase specialized sigma24 family protein